MAESSVESAACEPALVVRSSEETPAALVVAAASVPESAVAVKPPLPPNWIPALPAEVKVSVENVVAVVSLPCTPVFAKLTVVTVILRPSAAVSETTPVLLEVAVTPVCDVLALIAAAVCVPRSSAPVAAPIAPTSMPLMTKSPVEVAPKDDAAPIPV